MSENETTHSNAGGDVRKKVLFGVLGLLLVALAYDYAVARPGVETAYNKIIDRSEEVNADSTKKLTNVGVRELVGKDPSRTFQDTNGDTVEVYSWRSGLLIKSHDLFTVYKPNDGDLMFYRQAKFKYESGSDVAQISVATVIETSEAPEDMSPSMEGNEPDGDGDGSAAGPGGGGGGRPGGGGGFDPEARFVEADADGDGFWKGDEISDRARENMDSIDTDGDGAVSKEEFMARMEAMRAQFGGGGGGRPGGEGRPRGQRSRPEPESDDEPAETSEDKPAASETPESEPAASETAEDKPAASETPESESEEPAEPTKDE